MAGVLDLFGDGFVLLKLSDVSTDGIERSAASRGVPLTVHRIEHSEAAALYERALVLVRPDGHVAWRGENQPSDAIAMIDMVRGAGRYVAARGNAAGLAPATTSESPP